METDKAGQPNAEHQFGDRRRAVLKMRLRDMILGLWRRWYLVLPFLLITLGLCFLVRQSVPAIYRSQGSLVLMPAASTVGPGNNPYLYLGGMEQALDVLAAEVSTKDSAKLIADAHPGVSYVAAPDKSSSGSVMRVTVEGGNRTQVRAALKGVVALVPQTLTSLQDVQKVAPNSRITLMTLGVEEEPTVDAKAQTVAVLAAAGAGAGVSVLLTAVIDGRLLARNRRRAAADAVPADQGDIPDAEGRRYGDPAAANPKG
jgi:uncharacterized protein involved in exopolysaccharide biosynthesis